MHEVGSLRKPRYDNGVAFSLMRGFISFKISKCPSRDRRHEMHSFAHLWVVNIGTNSATKLTAAGVVVGTYAVGANPLNAVFGTYLWVSNYSGGTVSKLGGVERSGCRNLQGWYQSVWSGLRRSERLGREFWRRYCLEVIARRPVVQKARPRTHTSGAFSV